MECFIIPLWLQIWNYKYSFNLTTVPLLGIEPYIELDVEIHKKGDLWLTASNLVIYVCGDLRIEVHNNVVKTLGKNSEGMMHDELEWGWS